MALFTDPFSEIAAVLAVAGGIGALALWLRQRLIVAFIFAGILLGPAGLDWVHALDQVDLFAKLGIGLLHALQHNEFAGCAALTADTVQHREFLLTAGADVVLLPFRDAAAEAADMLASNSEIRRE